MCGRTQLALQAAINGLEQSSVDVVETAREKLVIVQAHICEDEGTAGQKISNKYLAPQALGMLAAVTMGGDEESDVFKNGGQRVRFSTRVVTMTASNKSVVEGFAYYGLSRPFIDDR
jgi:hypothetical protein